MDNRGNQGSFVEDFPGRILSVDNSTERMNVQQDQIAFENSESDTTSHDQDTSISDSESGTTNSPRNSNFLGNELVKLEEGDRDHMFVKHIFLAGMRDLQKHVTLTAIHRNAHSSLLGKTRMEAFQIYSDAVKKERGFTNIKYAWFSSTMAGIHRTLHYGFGFGHFNGGLHGSGIYLSPADCLMESLVSSATDESGVQHLLLCRVILGNQEVVPSGSKQVYPSSKEFDSGVDNLSTPKRYIVWSTHMNTHILPEYIISFRLPPSPSPSLSPEGNQRMMAQPMRRPNSAWMPISTLISSLSVSLAAPAMHSIKRYHSAYMEKRITREYLIQRVRQIAGDELLVAAIKSFRDKVPLSRA